MRRPLRPLLAALLLALGVVSCSDGVTVPGMGSANVSASGAVSASGDGVAIFQSVNTGGTSLFQIAMQPVLPPDGATWQVQVVRYADRPAIGTYQLVALSPSTTEPTAFFYYANAGTTEMFGAVSGELTITSSSPTSVRGAFTFTAQSTTNSARTVTVQGSFTAECPPGATCL
jgi:hypothetical protein